jgi:hypothetical protein
MTFFYYEINTRRFIQSTNIRALEEFSGLSYHKIWNWFNDGSNLHVDDSVICGCSDLVRGKQRIIVKEIPMGPETEKYIEQLIKDRRVTTMNIDNTSPSGKEPKSTKRTTEQPENRDMSKYDDFFNEVK